MFVLENSQLKINSTVISKILTISSWLNVLSVHFVDAQHKINGLVQDCNISSALALEILHSCTNPRNDPCPPLSSNTLSLTDHPNWVSEMKVWRVSRLTGNTLRKPEKATHILPVNLSVLSPVCNTNLTGLSVDLYHHHLQPGVVWFKHISPRVVWFKRISPLTKWPELCR